MNILFSCLQEAVSFILNDLILYVFLYGVTLFLIEYVTVSLYGFIALDQLFNLFVGAYCECKSLISRTNVTDMISMKP